MAYKCIRAFGDATNGNKLINVGDEYEAKKARLEALVELGFLVSAASESLAHIKEAKKVEEATTEKAAKKKAKKDEAK